MRDDVSRWLSARTWAAADFTAPPLLAAKRAAGASTAVVLPARDEAATVGTIVETVRRELVAGGLVDDLLVVDSGSTDDTAQVAARAGARVVAAADVRPDLGSRPGKGEALWKGLLATDADLVVFVDADLEDFSPGVVTGLLGPLLMEPAVSFVKAAYDRPLLAGGELLAEAGGRVTELLVRPLLAAHWPQLGGVVQPLAGEFAARRTLLARLPFVTGYGVDLALLLDAWAAVGLDGLAQVDLGRKRHRHQSDAALGRMAAAILRVGLDRLDRQGLAKLGDEPGDALVQFSRGVDGGPLVPSSYDIVLDERPPAADVR